MKANLSRALKSLHTPVAKAAVAAALSGAVGVAIAAPLIGSTTGAIAADSGSSTWYVSADGHLQQVVQSGSTWVTNDLTARTQALPVQAGSNIAWIRTSTGDEEFYYVGVTGVVTRIQSIGGVWYYDNVQWDAGAPEPHVGTGLAALALPGNHRRVYYVGTDNHVIEIGDNGGATGSGYTDLTAAAVEAHPTAAWPAAITATAFNGSAARVYVFDAEQNLQEFAQGSGWHATNITASSGGRPAQAGSLLASMAYNGSPRVYHFDVSQHVQEMAYGNGWHATDITSATGALPAVLNSSLTTMYAASQPKIYFTTYDNHVRELAWFGGWSTTDVTAKSCSTAAAAGTALSAAGGGTNGYGVYFASADNHVRELRYTNTWYTVDISGAGVATTCAPTGGGGGGGGGGTTHPER